MADEQAEILVVEDEAVVAEDIKTMVEQQGYTVPTVVGSGEAVLEAVEKKEFDLVLMDIKLAGELDGIETAHRLKEEFELYVIYLTAFSGSELLERAQQTEPLGYLNKPVDRTDLVTTLEVAVHKQKINKQLRTSEAKFRTLIETTPDVIYRLDPAGKFIYLSPALEQFGWEPEKLEGDHFKKILYGDEFQRVGRENVLPEYKDRETIPDAAPPLFDERRTAPRETEQLGLKLKLGDPEVVYSPEAFRYCEVHSAGLYNLPVDHPQKKFQGTIGVIRDVHERKKREQKIRKQTRRLASFGQMAAGLMHEINNANAYVKGNLDYLQKAWQVIKENLPNSAERSEKVDSIISNYKSTIESMRDGANRVQAMTGKVSGLALSSESSDEIFSPLVRLNQAVELIKQSPEFEAKMAEVEIKTDFSELTETDSLRLRGDPYEFLEIFVNLLSNAVRALEGETGSKIWFEASVAEGNLKVSVADNGPGIPEELESEIFEPFITSWNSEEGTGLGLSVVKDFVESFDGKIELDTTVNEGTEFVLTFPTCEKQE